MSLKKLNVLIAEDSKLFSVMIRDALVKEGFLITLAGDGSEAYEKLAGATEPYDIMLLDINMPNMDGMELLAKIKSEDQGSILPPTLIITSTKPNPELLLKFREFGARGYIIKSQSVNEIIFRIKSTVSKGEEMRKDLRELIAIPIEYSLGTSGAFLSVRSFDFSKQGTYIATTNPATVGSKIQVKFTIPDIKKTLFLNAKVIFVIKTDSPGKGTYPPGMGLRFAGLNPDDEAAIDKYVSFMRQQKK